MPPDLQKHRSNIQPSIMYIKASMYNKNTVTKEAQFYKQQH